MMAAKVGTGFVAELGSMRISDEIDALEVMGLDSLRLPVLDPSARDVARAALRLHVGGGRRASSPPTWPSSCQIGKVSAGGYFQIFWQFQDPIDLLYSAVKAMVMATFVVLVGCYYGYTAGGGPVGVGRATAQSMVVNIIGIHAIGLARHPALLGRQPRAARSADDAVLATQRQCAGSRDRPGALRGRGRVAVRDLRGGPLVHDPRPLRRRRAAREGRSRRGGRPADRQGLRHPPDRRQPGGRRAARSPTRSSVRCTRAPRRRSARSACRAWRTASSSSRRGGPARPRSHDGGDC